MSFFPSIDPLFMLSGFFVGLLVGQTGVGGGALMTPILVLLFGVSPSTAVGTDLLYACTTKSVGTLVHGMNHTVDWRIVVRLSSGSLPATAITLWMIQHYNINAPGAGRLVSLLVGNVLLLTSMSLLSRDRLLNLTRPLLDRLSSRGVARLTVVTGVILGVLVSLSSIGAGAIGVVALLMLYPRLPTAVIVGSDIAHAVPLTLAAGIGHWWLGSVDWPMLISLLSGSIPGIILGSYLALHIPDRMLRPILATVLCIVGGRLML